MKIDYIIYAMMASMFLITLIYFEVVSQRCNKASSAREREKLDREYIVVGVSLLVQLGCIFIASLILF